MSAAKGKTSKPVEKKYQSVIPPSMSEVEAFVRTQRYVTPFALGERFGIRLSVAKDLLSSLVEKGILVPLTGSSRIRVYAPVQQVAASAVATSHTEAVAEKEAKQKESPRKRGRKVA